MPEGSEANPPPDSMPTQLGPMPRRPAHPAPITPAAAFSEDATVVPTSARPSFDADRTVTAVSDSSAPGDAATLITSSDRPSDSMVAGPLDDSGLPTPKIEGYQITGLLGRGGMGAVYEAIQLATGRRTALKIMLEPAGLSAGEALRRRFEREVELVARLQHPGIVSVLDSGVRKGRYWYAMEFVPGTRLDQALKPGACEIRAALDLVAHIADAVDYAHQRGVLHRDLKPSNILIDEHGKPRVLDFGLAKSTELPGQSPDAIDLTVSGPGQLMGTLGYMSPEQAKGDLDQTSVRTDVYALGAIAYELLAGVLPCRIDGPLHDTLQRIISVDPARPSTLRPASAPGRLDADIDAMLARALEKEPARRYATAGAFAADIRRHLANQPIEARSIGALGRSARWVRRNRTVATVAAIAAGVLVISSGLFVARIIVETRRANANAALAQKNAQDAEETTEFYTSMIRSVNPDRAQQISVVDMLEGASRRLDDRSFESARVELRVRESLGDALRVLGSYGSAIGNLRRAADLRQQLEPPENAEPPSRAQLALTLHNLAATMYANGDYLSAENTYLRSLAIRQSVHAGDHEDLAMSFTHLAAIQLRKGKLDEAERLYRQALQMRQRLAAEKPTPAVAASLNNLAKYYLETGQLESAEALFREALALIIRLAGENDHRVASASINLAQCLLRSSKFDEARSLAQTGLDIRMRQYSEQHPLTAHAITTLAEINYAAGDSAQAAVLAERSLAILGSVFEHRPTHPDFARPLLVRGKTRLDAGDAAGALSDLERSLAVATATIPQDPRVVADVQEALDRCHAATVTTPSR